MRRKIVERKICRKTNAELKFEWNCNCDLIFSAHHIDSRTIKIQSNDVRKKADSFLVELRKEGKNSIAKQ